MLKGSAIVAAALCATPAFAEAECTPPANLPKARAEFPPPGAAVNSPISGYQLVINWGPQFCKVNGDEKSAAPRCRERKFGFTIASLRADGEGRKNPEYCKRMGPVPDPIVRENWCAIPSVPAMSHAWAKYGSCFAPDANAYFGAARSAFAKLAWPDMNRLSQQRLAVRDLQAAFAAANPGMTRDMFAVGLTPLGWLETVRLCLDTGYRPRPCPADVPGAGADATVRIWPKL